MEIEILNQNGSGDSKVSLADGIFNQEFNQDLVHQLVNTYIHNSHQRTKGQKNRSAVRGGGKKPWKQKGTGRARAGTIRSPASLSLWGDIRMVVLCFFTGIGIGPLTFAPVRFTVSTISLAERSISLWSKAFSLILML